MNEYTSIDSVYAMQYGANAVQILWGSGSLVIETGPHGEDLAQFASRLNQIATRISLDNFEATINVGDPDPTPDGLRKTCGAEHVGGTFLCTWGPGHSGAHVAGTGYSVAAVWGD